jgi:hypothetical protein
VSTVTAAKIAAKRTTLSRAAILNLIAFLLPLVELHFSLLKDVIGEEKYPIYYFTVIMVNAIFRFRAELKTALEQITGDDS